MVLLYFGFDEIIIHVNIFVRKQQRYILDYNKLKNFCLPKKKESHKWKNNFFIIALTTEKLKQSIAMPFY